MKRKIKSMLVVVSMVIFVTGIPTLSSAASPTSLTPAGEERVLVVFKDKPDYEVINRSKGRSHRELGSVSTVAVTVSSSEVAKLKSDPKVKLVEPDIIIKASAQTVGWGTTQVQAPAVWSAGYTGLGVKVAILDTGIAPHEDLVVAGGASFVSYTTSYADDQGHGTHVAGIIGARNNTTGIVGVAPNASLYAVKVLQSDGTGYLSDLVAGVEWAISNKMDIINMSLGTPTDSYTMHQVIDKAYANGVLVVAAAGNAGGDGTKNTVEYPAKYSSAIAVAATDSSNLRASFSSTGSEVEVSAPGVGILSTYLNNGYVTMSGTSMATPFVAGQLALLKQANPTASYVNLRAMLDKNVLDLGVAGRDVFYGYGLTQSGSTGVTPTPTPTPTPTVNFTTSTTVATDKLSYLVGETVTVTVNVVDQNQKPLSGATVSVIITPPKGGSINAKAITNANGQVTFKLSTNLKSAKGTYKVSASTSLTKYKSSTASSSFMLQ